MRPGDGETQEDDVSRHVRNEHMAQDQIAKGIDETGDDRHCNQEGWEGPKSGRSGSVPRSLESR